LGDFPFIHLVKLDLDIRVFLAPIDEQAAERLSDWGHEDTETNTADLTGPIATPRLKHRVEVRENTSDMNHNCLAACREACPEAAPLKDRQTEFILQPANPAADGGSGKTERFGGTTKTAELGGSRQISETRYVH
jgi:hypothetical protein